MEGTSGRGGSTMTMNPIRSPRVAPPDGADPTSDARPSLGDAWGMTLFRRYRAVAIRCKTRHFVTGRSALEDLGSAAARHAGSTPAPCTKMKSKGNPVPEQTSPT